MEEIVSQIRRGCELTRKLESNIQDPNCRHPNYLLVSCQEVVNTFGKAIQGLRFGCGESLPSSSHLEIGMASSSNALQAMDLLQVTSAEGKSATFYLAPDWPDATAMSSAGFLEFGSGSTYTRGRDGTFEEAFARGSPPQQVADVASVSAAAVRRSEAGPSGQRLTRRRKDTSGQCSIRVQGTHPENLDIPPDDGYTWRKYGQKDILGCKHPRSYYRCTHRNFGCDAKKQVQRLDEDPYTYEVTYCGVHSCRTSPTPLLQLPSIMPPNAGERDAASAATTPPLSVTQPFAAASSSMDLDGLLHRDSFDAMQRATGGSSSHAQGGRSDADWPVIDMADAMFKSGSSGSSIDAIFTGGQEQWGGDK